MKLFLFGLGFVMGASAVIYYNRYKERQRERAIEALSPYVDERCTFDPVGFVDAVTHTATSPNFRVPETSKKNRSSTMN